MRNLILIALLSLISCSKDDFKINKTILSTVDNSIVVLDNEFFNYKGRNGTVDQIFFRGKATKDNYLIALTSKDTIQRIHSAYDVSDLDYIDFSPGVFDNIYSNVDYKHYTLKVVFKDSTYKIETAYSKDTLDYFRYKPPAEGAIVNNHIAKEVTWSEVKVGRIYSNFNEYRNMSSFLNQWVVRFDGKFVIAKLKEPINKNSTKFQLEHKH